MKDNLLGQGKQYTVGDRVIELGWQRSAPMMGPDYMRRPRGYITTETVSRGIEKGAIDIKPETMRRLARDLAAWADTLEAHQTTWDAEHPAETARWARHE